MKHGTAFRVFLFLTLSFLLLSGAAQAKKNGVTDRDLSINTTGQGGQGACGTNCHQAVKAGAAISITANPCCTYTPGQTNINISVTTSGLGNVDTILGIMLLNNAQPYNRNIKSDGWTVEKDPNNNANPTAKNYNQKTGLPTLDQKFNWTLTAPLTPGTYYILAHTRFG